MKQPTDTFNTNYLEPIDDIIKRNEDLATQLDWDGHPVSADFIRETLKHLYAERTKGSVYYPLF